MKSPSYVYKAEVMRWVDGDTVWLHVDLGFRFFGEMPFRLYGINTPERGQINWAEATLMAETLAPAGTTLITQTYKDPDKYGRYLADLWIDGTCINTVLVSSGMAVPYYP